MPTISKGGDHRTRDTTCPVHQLRGPTDSGALPSPSPRAGSGSPSPLLLLKPAAKSQVKRCHGNCPDLRQAGSWRGNPECGATPAAGTQREEVTKSGFQWMPETTLKKVLRHCECSPASLCPPTAERGDTLTRPSLHLTPTVPSLSHRTSLNPFWDSTNNNQKQKTNVEPSTKGGSEMGATSETEGGGK